jgi:amino acid adenylation domain-containing protein
MFMTLLAVFQVLLWRYTGQADFIVGVPISGRKLSELENLVGFFVSSLLMRAKFGPNKTFLDFLAETREIALGAYAHPDIPFERLLEEFQPARNVNFHPMFQVVFAFRKDFKNPLKATELTFTPMDVDTGTTKFDLALSVTDCSEELLATFTYDADLFDADSIRRVADSFETLIEAIVADPCTVTTKLQIVSEGEKTKLLEEWNHTTKDIVELDDISQLLQAQVDRSPDSVAVVYDEQSLTYGDLNRRANQLAHYLQQAGVGPEVRVALCLEKSLEMVIALIAILKAGAAYVPLDPSYPIERLKFIMEDAHVAAVLTQQSLAQTLGLCEPKLISLDSQWEIIAREGETKPSLQICKDNLAYVIYTSGSTGNPKGIAVTRDSLCNFVCHTCDVMELKSHDRVLQFASIGFDTAVEEIFPCLAGGATLVLRTEGMLDSVSSFLQKCCDWKISVLDLPTAFWHELVACVSSEELKMPNELRLVIIGGEKARLDRLAQWRRAVDYRVRLWNTYGPSEATVVATMWDDHKFDREINLFEEVPIGRPISNAQTYILDENLIPVPAGVCGEMYIAGSGLARGYLNRPELTAENFIPNPFGDQSGTRLYKTGDFARYRGNGEIEFLGRRDNQAKLRGHRIEIDEIEAVLTRNPNVRSTAVVLDGPNGEERLVAYVVSNQSCNLKAGELRSFMKSKLPNYMIPSAFVFLDSLPVNSSGKIDRRALPAPEQLGGESERAFVPPHTPIEHQLAEIWAEVLKLKEVCVDDNFFDLGGHSLLAMRVISRVLKRFEVKFPLRCLFEGPTVAEMSTVIGELQARNAAANDIDAILAELEGLAAAGAQVLPDKQFRS